MHSLSAALFLVSALAAANGFLFDSYKNDVIFTLFRRDVSGKRVNSYKLSGLSSFDSKAKTYFIIHGWNGGDVKGWVLEMKDALLKLENSNVITVNWSKWAKNSNYFKAQEKADDAGKVLASFIKRLEKDQKTSRTRMHLIGHSLGGQVAGFAGRSLQSPQKIARITGLDTTGIGFNCLFSKSDCLDSSDATFVDEIHSLISALPKGHADFYPMPKNPLKVALETKIINAHFLAIDYFIKSIEAGSCAFKSTSCNSRQSFMDGKCARHASNNVGFFAHKPSSKPPNKFYMTIDINKPC